MRHNGALDQSQKKKMLLRVLSAILLLHSALVRADSYPTCGSCWCIPASNGTAPCPPAWEPQTSFSEQTIAVYQSQQATEIFTISCNPYKDSSCTTTPAQTYVSEDGAVCGYVYASKNDGSKSCTEYTMVTYPSRVELEDAGAVITHEGSCGLCSTTQDLSVYLTEDFTDAGKKCATKGLFNEQAGLECYQALGLTLECAKIWNYDGIYDGQACTKTCLGELTAPNNGPPPACELNDCLQCDEDKAGPIFSSYAGRTRRRSGLLSEIVRPCSSIARIDVYDPCMANPTCGC